MEALFTGRAWWTESNVNKGLYTLQYEHQRSGNSMQYRFYWRSYLSDQYKWYDNGMKIQIYLNGTCVFNYQYKSYQENNKGWSYSGTTEWFTVSDKTSGTVPVYAKIIDTNTNKTRDTSPTYNLVVDPAGSIFGNITSGTTLSGPTINVTKYSSDFSDTITLTRGSTTITRTNFTSGQLTFTEAERYTIFNNQNPNTIANWVLTLKTYSDGSQIGTTQTSEVYITTEDVCAITSLSSSFNVESSVSVSTSRPCGGTFEVYAYLNSNRSSNNCYSSGSQSSAWNSTSVTPTSSTIYSYNGSSKSGTLYWRIITKINGSQVGYRDYTNTYNFAQSLCGPTINNLQYCFVSNTAATVMGLTTGTYYNYNSGTGLDKLISGKTQIKLKVTGTAYTSKGASISKVYVTIPGQANKESSTSGAELTPNSALSTSGTIVGYVVDSRGYSASLSFTYTLKDYSLPVVNNYSIVRQPMSAIDTSQDLYCKLGFTITMPSYIIAYANGISTFQYQYSTNGSSWTSVNITASMYTKNTNDITRSPNRIDTSFTKNQQYYFRLYIVDVFGGATYSETKVIPISAPLIAKRSKRVGINIVPTHKINNVDVAADILGPAYIDGNVQLTGYLSVGSTITSNGKQQISYFPLDLSSLSASNFYPVTFLPVDDILDCEIHSPSRSSSAAYNQNIIHFQSTSAGWSDNPRSLLILMYKNFDDSEITIGSIGFGVSQSYEHCIWLRGGQTYRVYSNFTPTLHTTDYTAGTTSPSIFTVGTGYSGGTNTNVDVMFTPQSTISNGMYTSDNFKVNGNLSVVNRLYYGSNGRQDYHEAGFIYDQYGNMQHRRNNAGDTWGISSYSNGAKLVFYPETGHLDLKGDVTYYSRRIGSSNANVNTSGSNYYSTSCSNVPTDWVFVNTYHDESNDGFQIACSVVQNCLFTRIKNSGTWSSWSKIPRFSSGTGDPSGGSSGDVYFKYSA